MRNKYPGICYRCNKVVDVGQGHFEKTKDGWRTQHADCCIKHRALKVDKAVQVLDGHLVKEGI